MHGILRAFFVKLVWWVAVDISQHNDSIVYCLGLGSLSFVWWKVLKKMQYQIPKADVDAVVQCKPGAIEQVIPLRIEKFHIDAIRLSREGPQVNLVEKYIIVRSPSVLPPRYPPHPFRPTLVRSSEPTSYICRRPIEEYYSSEHIWVAQQALIGAQLVVWHTHVCASIVLFI